MAVAPRNLGTVFLVGAGPGDPGLITWRGAECLRRADAVLYDYLVNPRVLEHARPGAERVCLGRHGRDRIMAQAEINARLIALAQAGRTVVRLKGGDPVVFGRLAEEVEALTAAGIPYQIVPGVTAALAAGSYAGIPITHRDQASAVALVTGQEGEGKEQTGLDYAALATFPGTLVFYMGVTTAPEWTAALIAAGKPSDTPAALVRRCTWPDQRTIRCTLAEVPARVKSEKLRPPAIVIVGDVADLAPAESWFTARPLFGTRVLVTRPREQAEGLLGPLEDLGGGCLIQPVIEISPPPDWGPVDSSLRRLDQFDWLVFSSANGVRHLLDRLLSGEGDLRALGQIKLAVIGPGTAEALAGYHLKADLCPDEYRAESLAAALAGEAKGKRFLLARASRGREVLADELTAAGAQVEQIVVYESRDVTATEEDVAAALAAGQIDWITVTSSAIARSLVALFGESLRKSRLVSISPVTSATLRELGYEPAAEATEYTMPGVVAAILNSQGGTG
jgi:uroporphyrinogen III methyltransferase/synthase